LIVDINYSLQVILPGNANKHQYDFGN